MTNPEALSELSALLSENLNPHDIPADQQQELLLRGIVAVLEELAGSEGPADSSSPSVPLSASGLLYETAARHANENVRGQALRALVRLSEGSRPQAVDALYRLAVEENRLAARQSIITHGWQPSRPQLRALFDWFTGLESSQPYPADRLPLLTQAYLNEASPALRQRLLATAASNRAENWALILAAAESGNEHGLLSLIERYPSFRPVEREICLAQLGRLAAQADGRMQQAARDALSLLFIRHEDEQARQLVQSQGYLPIDSEQRALFLFLAGDWETYRALDFDHSLLISAYESAGRTLRRRLLEHSRQTGQLDWINGLESPGEVRWLNDLTDADWELAVRRLEQDSKLPDLWRLAQVAPPVWSAAVLDRLAKHDWQPQGEEEREGFHRLARLARESLANPLSIRPKKALHAPFAEITCLAMHPNGRVLAAGSNDQHIYQWDLPAGGLRQPPLIGPSPIARALAYSPSGDMLVSAYGDNRIRAFRLPSGQMVKLIEGHRALVRSLAIHPNGRTLYSASFDGTLRFWRFPHGDELKVLRPSASEIFSLALGVNGTHLISAGADCMVRVWTLPEGAAARELVGHSDTITHLAASPSTELVASAGRDGAIRVWNYISGGLIRTITNPGGPLTSLVMHPNDQVLIAGSSTGEVLLWSVSTGRLIDRLPGHRQPVTGLALSPEGDTLLSASSSTAGIMSHLEVWDLRTFLTTRLPGEIARPGAVNQLQERLEAANLSTSEKKWLAFSAELARWRQRYDIEISDFENIRVGEFDIEL